MVITGISAKAQESLLDRTIFLERQNGTIATVLSNIETAGNLSFSYGGNTVPAKKNILILSEGEQGIGDKTSLSKSSIADPNPISWKTGKLIFKNTPFPEVVKSLQNYSGKTIIFKDEGLKALVLTSTYENMDLSDILEEVALVLDIDYSKVNDTILIHPAGN